MYYLKIPRSLITEVIAPFSKLSAPTAAEIVEFLEFCGMDEEIKLIFGQEFQEWLENEISGQYEIDAFNHNISFVNDEDAVAFKLRWT